MTPERWKRVEDIYHAALAHPAADRAAFVRDACAGDEALRAEVESLLAQEGASVFLETPPSAAAESVLGSLSASLVGRQLGPYQITAVLGAGGMGQVYRARDSKLGREVAIKVLPAMFTADRERLARFEREARVLAALNHPHIGAIYGLETVDGVPALVLELVEGPTLGERLARGPMPVLEALTLAAQIAEALEAAHERGIIHRDLKPDNVKVTAGGQVKVLDFGLAKAASGDASGPAVTQAPTITLAGTKEGVILGTAAYMSPEQARGQVVDRRVDIWAFGCVLYEMLTRRVAFPGVTVTDTLAAVIEREPDWRALPAATPPVVTRLLHRCLDKNPKRRLHDIADARIEIEDALSGAAPLPAVVDRRPARLPWSIAAIGVTLALVAAGALTRNLARQKEIAPPHILRYSIAGSGVSSVTSQTRSLAFTPDGTRLVYIGNNSSQIFVRALDQLDATAVFTTAAILHWVCVSPDDQWIGFVENNMLKKIPIGGGPAEEIGPSEAGGWTWAPDNTIIGGREDPEIGLQRFPAVGGDAIPLTRPARARGELYHRWPEMLPGGRAVLFTITAATGGPDAAQVAVLDLATERYKVLIPGGNHAHYVSSGHLAYAAGGGLKAVAFDLERLETRGTPVTVLPRLVPSPDGAANFDVAADGTLAYLDVSDTGPPESTLVWANRRGQEEPLATPPRPYSQPRLSPDGKRVAVAIFDQDEDIWIWDLANQKLNQRTFEPGTDFFPVWTPNGSLVYAHNTRRGGPTLRWQRAGGDGTSELLNTAGLPSGVTPDGRLLFSQGEGGTPGGARDLMIMTLDGARQVKGLVQTPFAERNGVVSPDGRWLAYESDRAGSGLEIYVEPFPNIGAKRWKISTAGGIKPLWAPGGRELFYVNIDGAIMAERVDSRGGTWNATGDPAKIIEGGPYLTRSGGTARNYDVSSDGQRFLMVKPVSPPAAPHIIVVKHWVEELKRPAPVN